MATDTTVYIQAQLSKACPFPLTGYDGHPGLRNGQIKIKVMSERGQSNWLNITPEQFAKIERVLDPVV